MTSTNSRSQIRAKHCFGTPHFKTIVEECFTLLRPLDGVQMCSLVILVDIRVKPQMLLLHAVRALMTVEQLPVHPLTWHSRGLML